jgi:sulfate adenylyltransferase
MSAAKPESSLGFCVWLTGLSGAGKTTTASILSQKITQTGRRVSSIDGDEIRQHLSKGLGFSREDRDTNVRRVGFIASQIAHHGEIAICSLVSPYRETRQQVRAMFEPKRFIEVYLATPLEVCEQRDEKGHYARARAGEITSFTGIDDPYQAPLEPEVRIDTIDTSADANANIILRELGKYGLL